MELSAAQCTLIAQAIPVLLVALAVEGRVFGRTGGGFFTKATLLFASLTAMLAWVAVLGGVDGGMEGFTAITAVLLVAALFFFIGAAAYIRAVLDETDAITVRLKNRQRVDDDCRCGHGESCDK